MDIGLKDKIAIVTGAGLGVGRAIALGLAAEGVHLAIADLNEENAKKVAARIEKSGGKALAIKVDVSNSGQAQAMVDQVIRQLGGIDILVNNAGIVGPQGPWHELTEEAFDLVVSINFKGVYLCSRAAIPQMIKQRSGKIIIISSCAAKTGEEYNGVYSATKAAIHNLGQSMSRELGQYNINVNAVCPAAMNTDLMEKVYRERSQYFGISPDELRKKIRAGFKLPRELRVEDVANVVVFLASNQADMMTGQGVNITGGIEVH